MVSNRIARLSAAVLLIAAAQVAATACAVMMSLWTRLPVVCTVAMALMGACTIVAGPVTFSLREKASIPGVVAVWAATLAVPAGMIIAQDWRFLSPSCWDYYYSILAWMIAGTTFLSGSITSDSVVKNRWRKPAMAWALSGAAQWLLTAYWKDDVGAFLLGLGLAGLLLIACKRWLQLPWIAIQGINTLILIIVGLPLVELALHPKGALALDPEALSKYRSYPEAAKDLAAFRRWWNYFQEQWGRADRALVIKDWSAPQAHRLRPNSSCVLVRSRISINSLGFRGKEFPVDKGNAYRIVALGESTTFGLTIEPGDEPWPEFLEQVINTRLKPARRVEVINAGVPGATLTENLHGLSTEILRLKPDMLISYHGFNSFVLLDERMPSANGMPPPVYKYRPLQLLSDVEFALKLARYRRTWNSEIQQNPPVLTNLLETKFAVAYEQLMGICQSNGIRLVLGNYSMAVNSQSHPETVAFYQPMFGFVYLYIRANEAHTSLLNQLANRHPEITFVNTHPGLDGETERFLDIMHFTESGERQIAETFFAGITNILKIDLALPPSTTNLSP